MSFAPQTTPDAAARKQALQDQVLAIIQGRRLAGIALTMGLGKTLIGLRDMDRLLAESRLLNQPSGKLFLVAAPTQAILDAWPQEAHKFGLAHLLDHLASPPTARWLKRSRPAATTSSTSTSAMR
jgi:superfamily II DNA or RNA helicase